MKINRQLTTLCVVGSLLGLTGLSLAQSTSGSNSSPTSQASSQTASSYQGLAFTTPYPATSVSLNETTTLNLTLHNYGLPPQLLKLSVTQAPKGWTTSFLGDGVPVGEVAVNPDDSADISLQVQPPADAKAGDYNVTLLALGKNEQVKLPLTLTLAKLLPPKLTLTSDLPALTGSPSTPFSFNVSLKNDSGTDTTANLQAQSDSGFQVKFESAGNEVTSVPVAAGETQSLTVSVTPPSDAQGGDYQVQVKAVSDKAQAELPLKMTITGQPALSLSGQNGVLSARAAMGKDTPLELVVSNDGSAPADNVTLSATAPDGWKTTFTPETLPSVEPGQQQAVKLDLTPSNDAIAGDYVVSLKASSAAGLAQSADFRITTTTSTLWGIVAVVIIAAALLVMGGAVARFGRR